MYKKCSHCGSYTDANEKKCPCCRKNPLGLEIITFEKIVAKIKDGEIKPQQIWTKYPTAIHQALVGPSH